jgi:hypothetical protein
LTRAWHDPAESLISQRGRILVVAVALSPSRFLGPAVRLLLLAAVLVGLACGGDDNSGPGGTGSLLGRVTDIATSNSLDGVSISVAGHSTQSDATGHYQIGDLPAGQQSVSASRSGYQPYTADVTIVAGGETQLDIRLLPGTGTPDALTRLSASSGPTVGTVVLEWETASHTHGYNVYWSTSPGVTPSTGTKISNVISPYTHSGLTPGTAYYYVVTGIGDLAESAPSPEVHAIARGSIEVQIVSPTPAGFIGASVSVEARINSAFSLSAVTARLGNLSAPMTFDAPNARWRGQLSLAALASPATVLVQIIAQDVNGNLGDGSVSAQFDRPPTLTVTDPVNGAVVRPTAPIRVTCTDDSPTGCPIVTVEEAEAHTRLFTGQGNVNSDFSMAQYDGRQVFLEIRASDNAGQGTVVRRYVFVETSSALTQAGNAGSGIVIDADATRLLVDNTARWLFDNPGGDTLRIVDRGSGSATLVFTAESTTVEGRLTPLGALLITQRSHVNVTQLRELRNGVVSTLADVDIVSGLAVAGGFASWTEVGNAGPRLMRRDLLAGTSQQVTTSVSAADLAPNGDVVYAKNGEVFRFRGGGSQQMTDNAANNLFAVDAKTDGTRIVEIVRPAPCCDEFPRQAVLLDPAGDVVLASAASGQFGLEDLVNGGWIAFTRFDIGGLPQVWVRSPGEAETQLSFFGAASHLVLLKDDGEVVFSAGRLFQASPTVSAKDIGGSGGRPIYIDGMLHVMVGALLLQVN